MAVVEDGCAELRSEVAAFYAGFGQPDALLGAFRRAAVLVPLTDDGRLSTRHLGGIDWLCVFTGLAEYAKFLRAVGVREGGKNPYHTIFGWRLLEDFTEPRLQPTGVLVDIAGPAPMAFPPRVEEV